MKAIFTFGYKYTLAEIDELKATIMPDNDMRRDQFFLDYLIGPTAIWGDWFIGIKLASTSSDQEVSAEDLKLTSAQLRELKYIMMHLHITEPPKFYILCIDD